MVVVSGRGVIDFFCLFHWMDKLFTRRATNLSLSVGEPIHSAFAAAAASAAALLLRRRISLADIFALVSSV